MMLWILPAFATTPAELLEACEANDVHACRSFVGAAARSWLASDAHDRGLERRWRTLLRQLPEACPDDLCPADCAERGADCDAWADQPPERMTRGATALLATQRACDDGIDTACAALAAQHLLRIDRYPDPTMMPRLTAAGRMIHTDAEVILPADPHRRLEPLRYQVHLIRGQSAALYVRTEGDDLVEVAATNPPRRWSGAARREHVCQTSNTLLEGELAVIRGGGCDRIRWYPSEGGFWTREHQVAERVIALAPGPDGDLLALQWEAVQRIASDGTPGATFPFEAARRPPARFAASAAHRRFLLVDEGLSELYDSETGQLLHRLEGHCDLSGDLFACAMNDRSLTVWELDDLSHAVLHLPDFYAAPPLQNRLLPFIDAEHRRLAAGNGWVLTLEGGEIADTTRRPSTDIPTGPVVGQVQLFGKPAEATIEVYDQLALSTQQYAPPEARRRVLRETLTTDADGNFTVLKGPQLLELRAMTPERSTTMRIDGTRPVVIELSHPLPLTPGVHTGQCLDVKGRPCADLDTTRRRFGLQGDTALPIPLPQRLSQPIELASGWLDTPDDLPAALHPVDHRGRLVNLETGTTEPGVLRTIEDVNGEPVLAFPLTCIHEHAGSFVATTDHRGQVRLLDDGAMCMPPNDRAPLPGQVEIQSNRVWDRVLHPESLSIPDARITTADLERWRNIDPREAILGEWVDEEGRTASFDAPLAPERIGDGLIQLDRTVWVFTGPDTVVGIFSHDYWVEYHRVAP